MTNKRYKEIISKWNPHEMVVIQYRTNYSRGIIKISCAFLIEKYKKLYRLLKDVDVIKVMIYNSITNVELFNCGDLFNAWLYAIGR